MLVNSSAYTSTGTVTVTNVAASNHQRTQSRSLAFFYSGNIPCTPHQFIVQNIRSAMDGFLCAALYEQNRNWHIKWNWHVVWQCSNATHRRCHLCPFLFEPNYLPSRVEYFVSMQHLMCEPFFIVCFSQYRARSAVLESKFNYVCTVLMGVKRMAHMPAITENGNFRHPGAGFVLFVAPHQSNIPNRKIQLTNEKRRSAKRKTLAKMKSESIHHCGNRRMCALALSLALTYQHGIFQSQRRGIVRASMTNWLVLHDTHDSKAKWIAKWTKSGVALRFFFSKPPPIRLSLLCSARFFFFVCVASVAQM